MPGSQCHRVSKLRCAEIELFNFLFQVIWQLITNQSALFQGSIATHSNQFVYDIGSWRLRRQKTIFEPALSQWLGKRWTIESEGAAKMRERHWLCSQSSRATTSSATVYFIWRDFANQKCDRIRWNFAHLCTVFGNSLSLPSIGQNCNLLWPCLIPFGKFSL